VRAARRRLPEQRPDSSEERAARFPAARAIPSVVRGDGAHASDDGSPDHEGVPRPGQPPRVPGPPVGGGPAGRHVRSRPRVDGGEGDPGHRRRGQRRLRSRLDRLGLEPGQLVRVRPARLGPHALLGFDRTATGSDAVRQYALPVRNRFASRDSVPDDLLLWFHHVGWSERLRSGRTLWEELLRHYQAGVDTGRSMQRSWDSLERLVDAERFHRVQALLRVQEAEARWWRDASVLYWQSFSHLPLPPDYEVPRHPLDWYRQLRCPADPRKPRCDAV